MNKTNQIEIDVICHHYHIEPDFIHQLVEIGLIETSHSQGQAYVAETQIRRLDQILRLHHDLEINPQGIDVVFNLLEKIEALEQSLNEALNRLTIHE